MADDAEPDRSTGADSEGLVVPETSSFASVNRPSSVLPNSEPFNTKSPPPATKLGESTAKRQLLESQPMTASSSSSSLLPDQQANSAADTNGASPYGTRSRNRGGTSRPNYAEDREPDMDYESASGRKAQAASGSAISAASQMGDNDPSSGSNTRRSSNAALNGSALGAKLVSSNAPKDHIPGMSSFSLNPEAGAGVPAVPTSRKRKAPGSAPTTAHVTPAPTQTVTSGVSRRTGTSAAFHSGRTTNLMTFEGCQGYLKNGKLKADDGTVLSLNDQIYLICEPPGEPYYLARIMEFLHANNDHSQPVDSLRVNWFFRPRDIQRKVNDTRVVFASMQSDTCPITSLRGKCRVLHKTDIPDLDEYRKTKDSFWYEKMFDRYIHRYYEVIPTSQVINVPVKVKKVLDERWRFIVVEIGRSRELISAIKTCKRCSQYSASNDSVDCAVCKNTYHMNCVRPPLLKKPARGFGWSCGPCSRRQERKLEARNNTAAEGEEEEFVDEEEEDHAATELANGNDPNDPEKQTSGPRPPTAEQIAQAKLWPYRYLGIHCRVEDALDYDDRIYPRASSRLGPKHQANVQVWHGHPVEYVKPTDIKKKYMKGSSHKKDAKLTKETIAAMEADKATREKRPKWVFDEPVGYVPRGYDYQNSDLRNTAQLTFRMPQVGETSSRGQDPSPDIGPDERERVVDEYMAKAKAFAQPVFNLRDFSTNFLDKALELLTANNYQSDRALVQLQTMKRRRDLKEPELTEEELRKFEDGVSRYGSELRNVSRHVGKSQKHGEIVRFYYMWKKTGRGKKIWDNYEGRKGKKQAKQADSRLLDDVADDVDDSAFDNMKAVHRKRGFECKFCATRTSPQWRRAPATAPGTTVPADSTTKNSKEKSAHLMLALCQRCAGLWRKYGIQWENIDEVAKKVAQGGGRAWKRRIDEELLIELVSANEASSIGLSTTAAAAAASVGVDVPPNLTIQPGQDGPKKRQKLATEPQMGVGPSAAGGVPTEPPKKKVVEKPPEPPLIPEEPRMRVLPCAVCDAFLPADAALFSCRYCRLTVHRHCYGIADDRPSTDKWACDTCANDTTAQISTDYACLLCPVKEFYDNALMEGPKQSHKKKTDREREKERLEKEMLNNATELYYRSQEEKGRPKEPRQALKRTGWNNWVHVTCALFHHFVVFNDAVTLDGAEGFGLIEEWKRQTQCKLCKKIEGCVIECSHCQAPVHPSCAQQYGYALGFTIAPLKQTRNWPITCMTVGGENGHAEPVVYCKEHPPKKPIHYLYEPASEPGEDVLLNVVAAYARTHKQADISTTGTVRKALQVHTSVRPPKISQSSTSRASAGITSGTRTSKLSPQLASEDAEEPVRQDPNLLEHKCCDACGNVTSPKWYPMYLGAFGLVACDCAPPTEQSQAPVAESGAEPTANSSQGHDPRSNGVADEENTEAGNGANGAASAPQQPKTRTFDGSGDVIDEDARKTVNGIKEEDRKWMCHKCHLRKLKNPTPPREPTPVPVPEPVVEPEPEPMQPEVQVQEPTSPPAPVAWPHHPPPPPNHDPFSWPSQPEPQYHGPERMPNGVPHSPPVPAPPPPHYGPPPQHYGPPPPHHHGPPPPPHHTGPPPPPHHTGPPPYPYRDDRGPPYRGGMPVQYMPHQPNGYGRQAQEPPSFQFKRDRDGQLIQVPYIPPSMRTSARPSTPSSLRSPPRQPSRRMSRPRSPPMQMRSPLQDSGPHGPPEADSNPFAVPYASHSSPQPHYSVNHSYGSPRVNHDRPETPPNMFERDARWPSEIPIANGASASPSIRPSIRNILH